MSVRFALSSVAIASLAFVSCDSVLGLDAVSGGKPDCVECSGTCLEGGRCLTVIATGQAGVQGLSVTDDDVFWFTSSFNAGASDSIVRFRKDGGALSTLAPLPPRDPSPNVTAITSIATDSRFVYFAAESGGIFRSPLDGGPFSVFLDAGDNVSALALDSDNLYWANYPSNPGGAQSVYPGSVSATPFDGGTTASLFTTPTYHLAIDSDYVYAATNLWGTLAAIPKDGGAVVTLAASDGGASSPWSVASNGYGVFWADSQTGLINGDFAGTFAASEDDGGVDAASFPQFFPPLFVGEFVDVFVDTFPLNPYMLTTDPEHVYWIFVGPDAGAVIKYEVVTGVATTLMPDLPQPNALAVDSTSVYWGDLTTESVYRLTPK